MQPIKRAGQWVKWRSDTIPQEKRLSRDAVTSLWIHFLFQLGNSMSALFLNLYLWRLTHSLWVNGMYNIIAFSVTPLGFGVGGWLAKKTDRMIVYRLGIALISVFYLVVIFVQERVVEYYAVFAVFAGLSSAFYWVGYLILMYDVATEQNRIRYLSFNMIFFTLASLAGPAFAGYMISLYSGLGGYVFTFSLAFVMFVCSAAVSVRIKAAESRRKSYFLKFGFLLMKKEPLWLHALFVFFVLGLLQGIMLFLPNILLYQALPREDMIGYFGVLFSVISIITGLFMSKYASEKFGPHYLAIAAAGFLIGSCLLLIRINLWTVLGLMIFYSIFNPLQSNTASTYYFGVIDRLPLKGQLRIESVVFRELFLNAGRVISIFCLLGAALDLEPGALAQVMIVASCFQFGLAVFVKKARRDGDG